MSQACTDKMCMLKLDRGRAADLVGQRNGKDHGNENHFNTLKGLRQALPQLAAWEAMLPSCRL